LLESVLQVYLKRPISAITWEKAKILLEKVRAEPDARQASGVPAGGKVAGGFDAAAHPQMVTVEPEASIIIRS
jgi:hypothetical protein